MSAQAFVLQMVRAHFRRDDAAFAYAAAAIGRQAKSAMIRDEIAALVRRGFQSATPARQLGGKSLAPILSAPKSTSLVALRSCSFDELLLSDALQMQLDELVSELEYRTELAERGLDVRSRLLFHGPPGNGKTSTAGAFARALGLDAYVVSTPELVSSYLGATGKNLAEVFREIRNDMVVVFDELDAIGAARGSRSDGAGREANAIVTAMLTLMDQHRSGVIVGTTNRPDMLDPALLRRFDEHLLFPSPSSAQKEALAAKLATKFSIEEVPVDDCENLDEVTKRVRTEARRIVMRELRAADDEDPGDDDHGDGAMH